MRTVLAGVDRDRQAGICPLQAALVAAIYAQQHTCLKLAVNLQVALIAALNHG
jgi:hypothetical protein